jgi:hypothetical protein
VLGFTRLVDERGLPWIERQYYQLVRQMRLLFQWEYKAVLFSDTALVWSPPFPDEPLASPWDALRREKASGMLGFTSALFLMALRLDLPMRGAVAYGPCVMIPARQTFIGQPIVDAYRAEQAQDWVGLALHPSALSTFGDDSACAGYGYARHPVPINPAKPPPGQIDYAIDWPLWANPDDASLVESKLRQYRGTRFEARWRAARTFYDQRSAVHAEWQAAFERSVNAS